MRYRSVRCALVCLACFAAPTFAERHHVSWPDAEVLTLTATESGSIARLDEGVAVVGFPYPARIVRVELPPGARIDGVSLVPGTEEPLATLPVAFRDSTEPVDVPVEAVQSAGYRVWVLPEGDYRGHRIGHLLVSPFREADGALWFAREFDVELTLRIEDAPPVSRRVHHPRSAKADEAALRALLDAAPRPDTNAERSTVLPPELDTATVEYVIITTPGMAAKFQELADYKTREGLPAIVTTVDWILANYEGIDGPARIRSYLTDLYVYQGLRYVLLAGDTDDVPTRIVTARFLDTSGLSVSTDKYYGCLDGDWNADGDAEVGEAPHSGQPGDLVDLYAELAVARVPASSLAEATVIVNKWKSYTGYEPARFHPDYQNKILSLGEVLVPENWKPGDPPGNIVEDGADICENTLDLVSPEMAPTRMYQYSTNPMHPPALPEVKSAVIDSMNSGYGIIDHVGHGFRTNMSVGDGKFENPDADGLFNQGRYAFLYAINCTSGAILYDCIVERLLLNPIGGIVASIAATDLDVASVSENFKYSFFEELFQLDVTTLGDAFIASDLPFIPLAQISENAYRWTYMVLLAMGDPALEIWRDLPQTLDVAFSPTMELGAGTFTVTVTDGGQPVEDVRVTLHKSDGYGVGFTNASGVATIDFLPETVGEFQVTAVKNSYAPEWEKADVIASPTAALRVESMVFHDGTAGGGTGNADNRPDLGESIVVDVTLRNDGTAIATGVSTTFHANSAFLAVSDSTEVSVDVPASGMETLLAAYAFDVSAALPDTVRHVVVPSDVDLACNEGAWTEEVRFSVYQRILDLIATDFSITGDGDGLVETGETVDVLLTLLNRGEAPASAVVGVGSLTGSGFTVLDDTANFGIIAAGAAVQAGPLQFLSTGGTNFDLQFDFQVSDTHAGNLLARNVDIIAPPPPDTLFFAPRATSMKLSWTKIGGTRGYRVFRADSANGIYSQISGDIVEGGSFYVDVNLPSLTPYWYRVASIDSSGNVSAFSDSVGASTSAPILEGWPVVLPSGESKGSPTFANLILDTSLEVVFGWSYPMALNADGGDFVDGDNNFLTTGIFADIGNGDSKFWNSPAVWDLDGDMVQEAVFCAWQIGGGNGNMYVIDATGAIEPGWPQPLGAQPWSTAAVGDVDGDGDYEIFVTSGSSVGQYRGALFGFHHDGTEIIDGDLNGATNGVFYKSASATAKYWYGSPALADLDNDGEEEIILLEKTSHDAPTVSKLYAFDENGVVRAGFPYAAPLLGSTSSPVVADIDDNEDLEIIFVTENRIVVLNHNGSVYTAGWPKNLPALPTSASIKDYMSCPAVGDINGDGDLDITLGWLDGTLYAWRANDGVALSGFPVSLPTSGTDFEKYLHSPIIGNIDGDTNPEVIVSSGKNELFAVKANGSAVPGFPLTIGGVMYGSPAIWDIDYDGHVNLIVQTDAPILEVYDFVGVNFHPAEHPWPMFRHDQRKTGRYSEPILVDVNGELDAPAPPMARVHAPRPNPFPERVQLPFDVPEGGAAVAVRVFDVRGREVRTLADGRFPGGAFRISWDGRSANGHALAPGVYFAKLAIGDATFTQKLTLVR